jgi:hypothetical protein
MFDFFHGISSTYIGFGGAVIVLLSFYFFNRKYLQITYLPWIFMPIYIISLGAGVGLNGTVSDRNSALIAGLWAPIICSLLVTIIIRRFVPILEPEKTDLDHFID